MRWTNCEFNWHYLIFLHLE